MRKSFFLFIVFLSFTSALYAQDDDVATNDHDLALQYYNSGEFDKAAPLFADIYKKSPTDDNYKNYFKTLLAMQDFKDAQSLARKQIKKLPSALFYYVDLGFVYAQQGDQPAAVKQYETAIKLLASDQSQIALLANAFIDHNLPDYAIKTYERGRKIINDDHLFYFELAQVYEKKGDINNAITSYLDWLENSPDQLQVVENDLQGKLDDKAFFTELQTQCYHMIEHDAGNPVFSDLLVWIFVQKKDFDDAMVQVKAIDKRNHDNGTKVMDLCESAYQEGFYDAAIDGYQYIIALGTENPLYLVAQTNLLNAMKTKITLSGTYTQNDLLDLEKRYTDYFEEFGKTAETINALCDYASLEAFYVHNIQEAIETMKNALHIGKLTPIDAAQCKLDLGDYLLMNGQLWDAVLIYGQVDKAFKDNPLGEDARFKNAKLSYYNGDFDWAQAQLDAIKGSTSQLISNDAISLSVFMTDNIGTDSNTTPVKMYAHAELLSYQNKFDEANKELDSITKFYPEHVINSSVIYQKAHIAIKQKNYPLAADYLKQIQDNYNFDLLADDALFELADLYQHQLNDTQKAMDLYKDLMIKYKGSVYVIEARKRFRELRGDNNAN
jgi:tetratricopeptide (TPR) repeat protein